MKTFIRLIPSLLLLVILTAWGTGQVISSTGISGPKTLWGLISDTVSRVIRLDPSTHAIKTIEYEHSEIHSGSSWVCTDVVNVDTTSQTWLISTPNTTAYCHMIFSASCTGEMQFAVTEGATSTSSTVVWAANRNRTATPASSTTVVYRGATGGHNGNTTIFTKRAGASGKFTSATGDSRGTNEFILNSNTYYVVTTTTYANVYVTLELQWYEHTDLD